MCIMNSTKLKRKLAQKSSKALALRNDTKLKKYNTKKSYMHEKTHPSTAKIINEVIQIKRKRIKYMKSSAFGDTDSVKSAGSQASVIYVGTKYPKLTNLVSVIDLTKSDTDLVHPVTRKHRKSRREMSNKQITTIQSANNLACRSSEDIGLVVKKLNTSSVSPTKSGIKLKRTQPRTSMTTSENAKCDDDDETTDETLPVDDTDMFLSEVSDMINRDLRHINEIERMVYDMDIDTMVELYNVNAPNAFDGYD